MRLLFYHAPIASPVGLRISFGILKGIALGDVAPSSLVILAYQG